MFFYIDDGVQFSFILACEIKRFASFTFPFFTMPKAMKAMKKAKKAAAPAAPAMKAMKAMK